MEYFQLHLQWSTNGVYNTAIGKICIYRKELVYMSINSRFQVRDTEEELKKLDIAIKLLGYKDRSDWYRDMKRKSIAASENKKSCISSKEIL